MLHFQIAGIPSRYKLLNHIGNFMVANANNIWYSNKVYIIGQSAASFLSPSCKDMKIVQRLNASGVELSSKQR